jgi:hypothetical protein
MRDDGSGDKFFIFVRLTRDMCASQVPFSSPNRCASWFLIALLLVGVCFSIRDTARRLKLRANFQFKKKIKS